MSRFRHTSGKHQKVKINRTQYGSGVGGGRSNINPGTAGCRTHSDCGPGMQCQNGNCVPHNPRPNVDNYRRGGRVRKFHTGGQNIGHKAMHWVGIHHGPQMNTMGQTGGTGQEILPINPGRQNQMNPMSQTGGLGEQILPIRPGRQNQMTPMSQTGRIPNVTLPITPGN